MQSQRGQKAKPSRDMNHRDSQRDSHAMSTRGALFTFSSLSAAPAPKRWWERGVEGGGDEETVFPITRHYRNVPYTRVVGFELPRRWLIREVNRGGQLVGRTKWGGVWQRGRQLADDMDARLICISSLSLSPSLPLTLAACPVWIRFSYFFCDFFYVFVLFSAFALFVWLCLPFIYFAFHANSRIFVYSIAKRCPLLLSAASSTLAMQKFSCSTPAFLKILDTSRRRCFGQLPHYSIPCLILTDLWVI